MAVELSYVLITPHTITKSRTGGVLARLLSQVDLELVGAQLFASSQKMAEAYAKSLEGDATRYGVSNPQLLSEYVLREFTPSQGRRHRAMILLFRGEDACAKLSHTVGVIYPEKESELSTGESIRDTYSDIATDEKGKVLYFEPAVLTPQDKATAMKNLKILYPLLKSAPNIVENMVYPNPEKVERTLVILKPDNWKSGSTRPGSIIDMFSRTGLRLVGCKRYYMAVADAQEFYKDVKDALIKKLGPHSGSKALATLEKEFGLTLSEEASRTIQESFGWEYAVDQFYQIIAFMTGRRPDKCSQEECQLPGKVGTMVLIYEGVDAIRKIREVLGSTNPMEAQAGTIRREFGQDVMVNTAHASDSAENVRREMGIVKIQENSCHEIIADFLDTQS